MPYDGVFERCAVARWIEQIDGDAVRTGRNRAFQNLVLLNDIGLLRRTVFDLDLRTGLRLNGSGSLLGTVIHLVKPRMDDLRHDDKTIAVLLRRTRRSVLREG